MHHDGLGTACTESDAMLNKITFQTGCLVSSPCIRYSKQDTKNCTSAGSKLFIQTPPVRISASSLTVTHNNTPILIHTAGTGQGIIDNREEINANRQLL